MNVGELHTQATKAFSKQASRFDAVDEANPIIQWMRQRVYRHLQQQLTPYSHILEVNAGTGIDAMRLASWGHRVIATDASEGMVQRFREKLNGKELTDKIDIQQRSFLDLDQIPQNDFDHVFSNFGGLNCTDHLDVVASQIERKLKPGGKATLVMIAPFCPWEMAHALKGNFKLALRRWKGNGTEAHLEGVHFTSYYYSARKVRRLFGNAFKVCGMESLGFFTPPPYHDKWASAHPKALQRLQVLDETVARWPFFRSRGDHFIITLQKRAA